MKSPTSIFPYAMQTHRGAGPAPTGWRHALWLALLVAASIAFSLGFACAVPFAALGAVAALTLPLRRALLLSGAVWLANQMVGFAFLDYPWTANALAWGVALGVVAVLATLAAQSIGRRLEGRSLPVVLLVTFLGAFAAYEGGLFIIAAALLGGTEDFTPVIVVRIVEINAAAFIGLLLLNRIASVAGCAVEPTVPLSAAHRHA